MSGALTIFQSRKDQLCNNLTAVYEGLLISIKGRRSYAQSWTTFGEKAAVMCTEQIPELKEKFDEFVKLCAELSAIQNSFADKEERCAEDWRDVIERFAVVFRVNEEYCERKEQWKDACDGLDKAQKTLEVESVKPNFGKVQAKLEQKLEEAKQNKRDYLRRYKRKLNQLINVKDAYNKFKVRRMRHGWLLYAEALKDTAEKEMAVFIKMRNLLSGMKVGAQVAEAIAEQMEAAPEPVEIQAMEATLDETYAATEPVQDDVYAEVQEEKAPSNDDDVPANPLFDSFE